jgi:hypothetical protein
MQRGLPEGSKQPQAKRRRVDTGTDLFDELCEQEQQKPAENAEYKQRQDHIRVLAGLFKEARESRRRTFLSAFNLHCQKMGTTLRLKSKQELAK